jgi:hypothetical protein
MPLKTGYPPWRREPGGTSRRKTYATQLLTFLPAVIEGGRPSLRRWNHPRRARAAPGDVRGGRRRKTYAETAEIVPTSLSAIPANSRARPGS